MGFRISEIAKTIGIDSAHFLQILQERKFDVTSVLNKINNINTEALLQEFGGKCIDDIPSVKAKKENARKDNVKGLPLVPESILRGFVDRLRGGETLGPSKRRQYYFTKEQLDALRCKRTTLT